MLFAEKMNGIAPASRSFAVAAFAVTAFTGAAFAQNECTDAPAVTAGVPVPFTTIGATASPNRPTDEFHQKGFHYE